MSGQPPVGYQPTAYYGNHQQSGQRRRIDRTARSYPMGWEDAHSTEPQRQPGHTTEYRIQLGARRVVSGDWGLNRNLNANINAVPLYSDFAPQYADPTVATTNPQQPQHLTSAFERPNYPGFGDINIHAFMGKSSYNALQVTLNHRLRHGLTFGVSYAWSRFMNLNAYDPLVADNYARNWGPAGADRRQVGAINYSYDLPKPGQLLQSKLLGAFTDNWTLSGITGFSSGRPIHAQFLDHKCS